MGRSVDYLDVYNARGPEAVAAAVSAALAGPAVVPAAPPADSPHPSPYPSGAGSSAGGDGTGGAGGGGQFVPPDELILPSQPGLIGRLVLAALFTPTPSGEPDCWRLRRFGGKWYVYVHPRAGLQRWKEIDDGVVRGRVRQQLERYWVRKPASEGNGVRDGRGRWWKFSPYAPSDSTTQDILASIAHLVHVSATSVPAWLPPDLTSEGVPREDDDRWLRDHVDDGPIDTDKVVAFRNGLLDIDALVGVERASGVRLVPHSGRWFSMSTLDTELDVRALARIIADEDDEDSDGTLAERWLEEHAPHSMRFLRDITGGDPDKYEALQRLVGYYMTPDTSLDVIGGVVGLPGTGKGTLVELITAVVGDDNVARTNLDTLADKFGMAPLVGKTLAVIPEMHVGRSTNVAMALSQLKSISGGDPQQIQDKYVRASSSVRMTVKFLLTPNEWPRLPDSSAALVRRLVMIPVYHRPKHPDPGLGERMVAERAAVRVWALLGLRRLWRAVRGGDVAFPSSAEGREMLREVEYSASPMRQYIEEECVVGPDNSCTTQCLREHHIEWRKRVGYSGEIADQTFGLQLRAALGGWQKAEARIDGKRVKIYRGIRPRMELDEHQDGAVVALVVRVEAAYEDGGWALDGEVVTPGRPRTPVS